MKISVLLPVYNAGSTLNLAIESILVQDFADFEFLIIDDGSTDRSPETIREYAERDPRIRAVFHQSNFGLAKTLNEGIRAAEGEFVARMDQDDEALPHRLRTQYLFMKSRPTIAVAGSYVFHMGKQKSRDRLVRLPITPSEIVKTFKHENCIYHPSVMFRREQIIGLGGYRSEFKNAEDYDLWLRVSQRYRIANIPVALLRYRFSIDGMTLGRKWEQLYYVLLAQVCHEHSDTDFREAELFAQRQQEQISRQLFLQHVAKGTFEELVRLGYWREALRLLHHFACDIGWLSGFKIMLYLVKRGTP